MSTADAPTNAAEFSVSELSFSLKRTVEDAYGHVRVRGEISGYRGPHSSGHAYFALKDAGAKIDAVIWKGVFARLRFKPEEGMEVIASGKITTYPGKSSYQIVIDNMQPAGAGALMALLEERKKKLAAEGLFDPARKQLLPEFPQVVGVITSPTGAVIRDILHRISDRFPVHVLVWPVRVQGETSAAEVAAAIRGFNDIATGGPVPRPDVLIVARGGGSLEDLWSFNEEIVVRAAAESDIPLVSAVGHETDTTLIDYAADIRAPTPTAAAEMVVSVRADWLATAQELGARLSRAITRSLDGRRKELNGAARALPRLDQLLAMPRQRLDMAASRLPLALTARIQKGRLALAKARLTTPEFALQRAAERLRVADERLGKGLQHHVGRARMRYDGQSARFVPALLLRPVARLSERLDGLGERATRAFGVSVKRRRDRLAGLGALLGSLSYHGVLARGFALVRGPDGQAVRHASSVSSGMALEIEFADGRVQTLADGKPARKGKASAPPQGDLFS